MNRSSLILALFVVAGCASNSRDWRPTSEAQLFTETTDSADYTSSGPAPAGTLYIYDPGRQRLLYSGTIKKNQSLRMYDDRAELLPAAAASAGNVVGGDAKDPYTAPLSTQPTARGKVIARYNSPQVKAYVIPAR